MVGRTPVRRGVAALVVLLVVAAGCASNDDKPPKADPTPTPTAPTEVTLAVYGPTAVIDAYKRLASTLIQTMQYGTPLTEALRTLSAELRQDALTRFEARAARLPVLLTMPTILFILPCVFIIAGGPAILQIMRAFS